MFLDAIRGIVLSIKSESNIRIHIMLATVVIVIGVLFQLNMGLIFLVIGSVISTEMLNTSIESLCDLVHPDESDKVRNIKDIAAGAVLFNVVISVLVGALIVFQSIHL